LGRYGLVNLWASNNEQSLRINNLSRENIALQQQIKQLSYTQNALESAIENLNPNQSDLVLNQLNSLIGGANQSLFLYHDYAGAVKLLNYAKQLLATSNDPVFSSLKINLAKDLDNLQTQNTFDNTMLSSQLENLIQSLPALQVVAEIKPEKQFDNSDNNLWHKFVYNVKESILGLVKVVKTNPGADKVLVPENELMIRQQLQLNLLNARQALITHNQDLWAGSLQSASTLLRSYFALDGVSQKDLSILNQLGQTTFSSQQTNLDLTMQALIKAEQLMNGK
jgi:uncharacterized protein HemX